jgi:iron complex outermembrane receptor protein
MARSTRSTPARTWATRTATAGDSDGLAAYETGLGTTPSDENHLARGLDLPYHDNGNTGAYTAQADYTIGGGTLTTIVSYRDIKNDNLFDPYPTDYTGAGTQFRNQDTVHYDQLSEEIHFNSPVDERFRYVLGLFNFRLKLRDDFGLGFSSFPGATTDVNFDESLENDNYAAFGEGTFDITPQLHFIAGLRGSHDQLRGSMDRTEAADANFLNEPGDTFGPLAAGTSTGHDDLSWRTGLQYQITPDAMAYATVSKGYKGPGLAYAVNSTTGSLAGNNGIVKPEIVHNYEAGLKTQWFDRRLTANLSAYTEIFDDFQTSIVIPGTFITTTENAQQMRTSGALLTANWFVTPSFSLAGNANYDHARFTNFKNASCYSSTQTAAQGCVNGSQDLSGHRLANTPTTTLGLTARYQQPLGDKFMGFLQVNDTYHSSEIYSSLGDPQTVQGGFSLVNVSAGIDTRDGRWGVSVYGNNVFDKHYVDLILASGGVMYLNDISYTDLQTFGIALTAKF